MKINFIWKVESYRNLRPRIRIGQAETFVGLHCGNQYIGERGAIGFWWNNVNYYGVKGNPIDPSNALWQRKCQHMFIPAQHGNDFLFKFS